MFLIVGLGNPGRDYQEHRHNIGFILVNRLAKDLNVHFTRIQSKSLIATTIYSGQKITLAKPQTFMNLSGVAVQGLVRFYKISFANLLVIHDDIDLPLGTIRIRPNGGSAGQKGMESIIDCLGTNEFPRLRLGVGRPPNHIEASDFVLQKFSKDELTTVSEILLHAMDAVLLYIKEGIDASMNKYNGNLL